MMRMFWKSVVWAALAALPLLMSPVVHGQATPPCTPGVNFGSLIGAVNVGYGDGRLNIGELYAVCLAMPAKPSVSNYPYDPDQGGKLSTLLKDASGQVLTTYVWYAERIGGLWEMSRYKIVGGYEAVKPLAAGNYLLEFAVDGQQFSRFPFSVTIVKSDDPYQPSGNRYFIEGPWNEYGNLFYQRNDPKSSMTFTTWVREKSGRETKRSVPYRVKLIRVNDGSVLGEESSTLRLEPRWLRASLFFRPPGDQNSFLKASEVLNRDGAYSIRFEIDGNLYGEYPFTVKGGQIPLQGRQIRETTDPMDYITDYVSGGRYTSWWIRRDAAAK